ncbi:class I SAM-dependent methyltransferase [Streptomyces sp. NPDC007863]|uniref:class I SAM-dependent methyltransferase n=1 Tax=Streptomyces sp. NPDC007863 TaxID=3154894 RepID=UPI00340C7A81
MPELGVGHGRDALYFAREGFTVHATAFSPAGLDQRRAAACAGRVEERVTTTVHDVREPLPLPDASVDAVFAHMLLWMALSTQELHNLVGEVRRVLRPGGTFVCTVRRTGDASYGAGTGHRAPGTRRRLGARRLRGAPPRDLVDALADGWQLGETHAFEEGGLPRSCGASPRPCPVGRRPDTCSQPHHRRHRSAVRHSPARRVSQERPHPPQPGPQRHRPAGVRPALGRVGRLNRSHSSSTASMSRRGRRPPAGLAGRRGSGPASPYGRFELDMNSRLQLDPTAPAATVPARRRAQDEAAPAGR